MAKFYRDIETGEVISRRDLYADYVERWLIEKASEEGFLWMSEHPEDFSFETFLRLCSTAENGTLEPIEEE